MEELTYAQQMILEEVQKKQRPESFQDLPWGEYNDYNDYNDCHGDYYDADYN